MSTESTDDPLLDEIVEASMDGLLDLVPPEVAAVIRDSVRGMFTFHPEGQRLLRQARVEAVSDKSTEHTRRRPGGVDTIGIPALSVVGSSSNGNGNGAADAGQVPGPLRRRPA